MQRMAEPVVQRLFFKMDFARDNKLNRCQSSSVLLSLDLFGLDDFGLECLKKVETLQFTKP
jgi:hypothetical protein